MVRLGLYNNIIEVVRQGSLGWLGHVVRKEDDDSVEQAWRKGKDKVSLEKYDGKPLSWVWYKS